MSDSVLPPQLVFDELMRRKSRPARTKNLTIVHRICEAQNAGTRDFRIPVIGRLIEAAGGPKARVLNNAPSQDYRALISAWRSYSGPMVPNVDPEEKFADALAARFTDPALRSVFLNVLAERNRLQAELDLLKSVTSFTVDRRPIPVRNVAVGATLPGGASFALTGTERDAIAAAMSPAFLADQGWTAGKNGEVLTGARVLYEFGYLRALKKILDLTT